ncbi:PRC-barrel domain containing protein [Trebonia kvetii]|uniref:PRC-barrel domain containing protein n=1 Tax=Trebonia kvetii TaxID=2480626 RepID=A0A6P2BVC4_9ACTN|nr:PRC-barrel domain-containing protein [Trebonia kvetii]TVZ02868.1 PRC-barrel domain containing protein [Trebonia kvetii]
MSKTRLFLLGADVRCADKESGKLTSLVVSPGDDVVTHLVVEAARKEIPARLVPFDLVDSERSGRAGSQIQLRCSVAEFEWLDPAEATYSYPEDQGNQVRPGTSEASWPEYAPPGLLGGPGLPPDRGEGQESTVDIVPDRLPGEDEVARGQHAHAKDGDIGHVEGIVVDSATGRVAFVLVRAGHLWNRKAVLVPRSAVTAVGADGFHLDITTQQVHDLPDADLDHLDA